MPERTISVVGLGYIGLPTAAVIASRGIKVVGVDVSASVVETVNSGGVHIVEPDLDIAVHGAVSTGYLKAYVAPQPADVFLIAVPTPFDGNHQPDLSFIDSAARNVARVLKPGDLVILESTSPVGATEMMCRTMASVRSDLTFPIEKGASSDIRVAHCPERVLPGRVLRELVDNDRVIGGMTDACCEDAKSVYRLFVRGELLCTDVRTAEMCKLAENAYRDVNIAFANELSLICDRFGIDVWDLTSMANRHPRVNILNPGPGVGGHCIAVDPWFIISAAPDLAKLMDTARQINDFKPDYVAAQIVSRLGNKVGAKVACLGLSYKANVDDLRQSPALRIVSTLLENQKIAIQVVEPHIAELPLELNGLGNVSIVNLEEAFLESDLLVGLVRHDEFVAWLKGKEIEPNRVMDFAGVFLP